MNFENSEAAFKYIWHNHQAKFKTVLNNSKKLIKSDTEAIIIKELANELYQKKNFRKSHVLYVFGLKLAEPGGTVYGTILANLSALHFTMAHYKECLEFIKLCKETAYDKSSYPKLLIREIKALRKSGNDSKASEILDQTIKYIRNCKISINRKDTYLREAKEAISTTQDKSIDINDDDYIIPDIIPNEKCPSLTAKAEIKYSKEFGNHVVAKEKINRFETILVENPFTLYTIREFCSHCFKSCTFPYPCKVCLINTYCSEYCRLTDWEEIHKWECNLLTYNIIDVMDADVLLAFKIFLKACNDKANNQLEPGELPKELDLYGDFKHFSKDKNRLFQNGLWCCQIVLYLFDYTNFYAWAVDKNIFGNSNKKRMRNFVGGYLLNTVNTLHYCSTHFMTKYETNLDAIYLSLSKFNHSCLSNTSQYYSGTTVVVKAYSDIEPGEQIFITWNDNDYSLSFADNRKALLKEAYNFNCKCIGCTTLCYDKAVYDGFLCSTCKSLTKRTDNFRYKCLKCGKLEKLSKDFLNNTHNISKLLAINEETGDRDALNNALKLVGSLNLHPNNFIILQCHIDQAIFEMKSGNIEHSFLHYANFKKVNHKSSKFFSFQFKFYSTFEAHVKSQIYSDNPYKIKLKMSTVQKINEFLEEIYELMMLYFPLNGLIKNMEVIKKFLEVNKNVMNFKDEASAQEWLKLEYNIF